MILDQGLAAAEWPGQNPVGQCAYIGSRQDCIEIVGISESRRSTFLSHVRKEFFVPAAQAAPYRLAHRAAHPVHPNPRTRPRRDAVDRRRASERRPGDSERQRPAASRSRRRGHQIMAARRTVVPPVRCRGGNHGRRRSVCGVGAHGATTNRRDRRPYGARRHSRHGDRAWWCATWLRCLRPAGCSARC